ncbi:hypothetical protein U1Q18_036792 [Sarracenia purpurea var. burkii]
MIVEPPLIWMTSLFCLAEGPLTRLHYFAVAVGSRKNDLRDVGFIVAFSEEAYGHLLGARPGRCRRHLPHRLCRVFLWW